MYEDFILYSGQVPSPPTSPASDRFPDACQQSARHDFFSPETHDLFGPTSVQGEVYCEPQYAAFFHGLPSTSMGPGQLGYSYDQAMAIDPAHHGWMGRTPLSCLGPYENPRNAPVATLSQSWRGFDDTDMVQSSFRGDDISSTSFFDITTSQDAGPSDCVPQQQASLCAPSCCSNLLDYLQGLRKMTVDVTHKIREAETGSSKLGSGNSNLRKVNNVRQPRFQCDYPGCHKYYSRTEHLKRHKQSHHGEGRNRFSCEFCGNDRFNRHDNLTIHRRLHAQNKRGKPRVKFIAAAVRVIEEESENRRGKASPEPKLGRISEE
ncbi:hypothetical protein FOXG_21382 [Fusarium oxysporum f. sp. lycopersici 4287]|uniref:C2H2-type domain-containing protein n=1 Tax=Fusarium oxysporum f. sp. lycopersici (strain 4287 / CBS 123668 / FGSC 9935 / NRRL 34936) TaxID=426428 RepID=A0A0J9VYH8_FUSO4|nr:hypothetical protein FOXG_20917 [Fusarium oxysporum f. sp. lycopersici 4287]XP_018251819.1 hypothetical protein FOXG_20917 [Fusarium oxysporum f. sp. lycopersici 4287]XP_018253615.1 hypothetical protein FOXG_21382 [Fusarium oxysporum f. sp. lycopersici 4287]KAJ9413015.1 hypothetical protein QL093DRAFT_2527037 [Fusarium oxysporum]KNB13773.1 hypothetical protein FOXG_20917 [Fusarium oxysporum f. sp. lycopersici 4287]KNB13774.1 hypothetical protein FOXG_20917 [Fusarium oxysporum f. sp. lycoper